MRNFRFWIPAIAGILVTPIFIYLAARSTAGGVGSFAAAKVLYPLSMVIFDSYAAYVGFDFLSNKTSDSVCIVVVLGLAIFQYPFYGYVLSYARLKHRWWARLATGIIYLHLVGIIVYLVTAGFMWATTAS
jgi:hypothetical protein